MKRKLALGLLSTVVAFAAPVAQASHPSWMCLDITPDSLSAFHDDDTVETLHAYPGSTDAGHPPQHEGCVTGLAVQGQDWGGTTIDFEIAGVADPDSSDSPGTPDMTCTVAAGTDHCAVTPPVSWGGTQTIRAWLDLDMSDSTVEADTAEGTDDSVTQEAFQNRMRRTLPSGGGRTASLVGTARTTPS